MLQTSSSVSQNIDIHLEHHYLLYKSSSGIFTMTIFMSVIDFFYCSCVRILILFSSFIIFLTFKILFELISLVINHNITSHSY